LGGLGGALLQLLALAQLAVEVRLVRLRWHGQQQRSGATREATAAP
jgi:hypothetical protein